MASLLGMAFRKYPIGAPTALGAAGAAAMGRLGNENSGWVGRNTPKEKELNDISKYEQGIPVQRVDMNTGLDKYVTRKKSDYRKEITRDNPWRYDMSINLDAKIPHEEAEDYLRKNIPFVARKLDNTEYLSDLMYGITKEYGLSDFKNAVDDVIHKLNPMNIFDEEGNEIKLGKGGYSAGDIHDALMIHFPKPVLTDENKQELRDYWNQKYSKNQTDKDPFGFGTERQ